jgi:hypothetical protein
MFFRVRSYQWASFLEQLAPPSKEGKRARPATEFDLGCPLMRRINGETEIYLTASAVPRRATGLSNPTRPLL